MTNPHDEAGDWGDSLELSDQADLIPGSDEEPIILDGDALAEPTEHRLAFEKGMSYYPPLVLTIMAVNVIVFIWQVESGSLANRQALIASGALHRASVLHGQVWRLLTHLFLHGSFDHIAGNLVALYILGIASEHAYGPHRSTLIYLLSGLAGGLLSVAIEPQPTVGASGAIFGIMGAMIVFIYRHKKYLYFRDHRLGLVLLLWAGWQFLTGLASPYIANFAHLGGLAGGAIAAWFIPSRLIEEWRQAHTPPPA